MAQGDTASNHQGIAAFHCVNIPDDLEEILSKLPNRPLTKEERQAQRISFAMGMLPFDSTITREYIEDLVKSQYG